MIKSQPTKLTRNYFATHAPEIGKILQRAVADALLMHKRLGNPVPTWKDGKVVILMPDEFPVIEPPDPKLERQS